MSELRSNYRRRQWFLIATIALIFVAPSVIAWLTFNYSSHLSIATVNKGHLLAKPLAISRLAITDYDGKTPQSDEWTIAYLGEDRCDKACLKQLDTIKRVRVALGKDMLRVRQTLVTDKPIDWILRQSMRKVKGLDSDAWLLPKSSMTQLLTTVGQGPTNAGIFLVDPLGNIFMSYPSDTGPDPIYKDIQRALKASQIG